MGCDIYGVVQFKWKSGGAWYNDLHVEDGRNYVLFGALAGVRNRFDVQPLDQPRGLPEDFSCDGDRMVTAPCGEGEMWMGGHSFSHFTLDELIEWPGWDQAVGDGETLRDYCDTFLKWLDYLKSRRRGDDQEVRIVIGFDN